VPEAGSGRRTAARVGNRGGKARSVRERSGREVARRTLAADGSSSRRLAAVETHPARGEDETGSRGKTALLWSFFSSGIFHHIRGIFFQWNGSLPFKKH
jgi:hypothetical protein